MVCWTLWAHRGGGKSEPLHSRLVSRWIRQWQRLDIGRKADFSHVELQRGTDECFSADGYVGRCRWKKIHFSHPQRWYPVHFTVTDRQDTTMLYMCREHDGKPYNYLSAALGPLNPIVEGRYCSKVCGHIIESALGVRVDPVEIWPDRLIQREEKRCATK